ncbi:MAG TPA: PrgI family protein [Nitrososphaera sp.]|nr:PrgI family protein [Nitrososphaera sp.]
MVGQVDVLWFETMGVFSEPIFNFSFVRLTLRQVGTLFGGLLFAYALSTSLNQSVAGATMACLALLVTFYRPRVMPLEQYIVAAMRFLAAKNQRVAEKQRVALLMANNVAMDSEPESESESN